MDQPQSERAEEYIDARPGFQLVGAFMFHWSRLEAQLNISIEKLLGLDVLSAITATSNIPVRSKIHIVNTALSMEMLPIEEGQLTTIKLMKRISDMSEKRNIVAHESFFPTPEGYVEFFRVKAKGKLAFPSEIWKEAQFSAHFREMIFLTDYLKATVDRTFPTRRVRRKQRSKIAGGLGLLAPSNYLSRLLLTSPDSLSPNLETDPQTHKKP